MSTGRELTVNDKLSKEQEELVSLRLMELLRWQAGKFNGVDSTSMPVEKAQELLESLTYTLSIAAGEEGTDPDELLKRDLQEEVRKGQDILVRMKNDGFNEWNNLCIEAPQIKNVYYVSTIKDVGKFFERYDIHFAAHDIPCSIDYPLLDPVPEELKGIEFIREYIRRVRAESKLVNGYEPEQVMNFLRKVTTNYKEDYMNLCEPVLVCSVGRTLLDYEMNELILTPDDVKNLKIRFEDKTKEEIEDMISQAMDIICESKDIGEREHFSKEVDSLAVRISIAKDTDCLENIFKSC